MRYEMVMRNDNNCYATALSYDKRMLKWESTPGCDTLVVEVPYGDDIVARMKEEVCPAMSACELIAGRYVEVAPCAFVRHVTAQAKARDGGCPLHSSAKTYAVFAMKREGDTVLIHLSNTDGMIEPIRSIPLELHVDISRVTQMGRKLLFKTYVMETDFWRLSFPNEIAEDVHDGDLAYQVGGLQIPLTKRMISRGEAYVKSQSKPIVVAVSEGILLV